MMNNSTLPTNSPAPNAEEGAVSPPLEKLPKLNLPPKPVLATAAPAIPSTPPPAVTPAAAKPAPEPSSIVTPPIAPPPPPTQVVTAPAKKSEATETSTANKKRATLSMPVAVIAFVVAFLGLIVQIFAFLHLF